MAAGKKSGLLDKRRCPSHHCGEFAAQSLQPTGDVGPQQGQLVDVYYGQFHTRGAATEPTRGHGELPVAPVQRIERAGKQQAVTTGHFGHQHSGRIHFDQVEIAVQQQAQRIIKVKAAPR